MLKNLRYLIGEISLLIHNWILRKTNFNLKGNFKGDVVIVGAGASGLYAGYKLHKKGINIKILEASSELGGRIKKSDNFANFPLDLGAEWIHTNPEILNSMIGKKDVLSELEAIDYKPNIYRFINKKLKRDYMLSFLYKEWKFKSASWFDYFEKFIIPDIKDCINLNACVTQIDYTDDKIKVITKEKTFLADKVLITVPITILQEGKIRFVPEMPKEKKSSINKIFMGEGFKIFIKFKDRFYKDLVGFGGLLDMVRDEKTIYDACYGKETSLNIIGILAINDEAKHYNSMSSESEIITNILNELDDIFSGKATDSYISHKIQNWTKEPFIKGSYSTSFEGNKKNIITKVTEPIDSKIYFSGEALTQNYTSTVHGACISGLAASQRIVDGK